MKFIMLFGPQAVGKMTVGEELAKLTNLKLHKLSKTNSNYRIVPLFLHRWFLLYNRMPK